MITYKPSMPYPVLSLSLFLLVLQPFCTTTAQTYKNVSLGSFLIAGQEESSSPWVSPSGEFAFGFQEVGIGKAAGAGAGFLLAIWFNKIPEKTIVWWANGNELAPAGSKVELTTDGHLVLLKATTGEQIWKADDQSAAANDSVSVSYAAMLDTGNFVLASTADSVLYLWETFKRPTDTLLPSQTMVQDTTLSARYGETNYSDGRFDFILQKDGNLVSYAKHSPLDSYRTPSTSYYASGMNSNATELIFNRSSGSIYLAAKDGSMVNLVLSTDDAVSTQDFYHRATLEYDGAFRHYVYPKGTSSAGSGERPMVWTSLSAIPLNICLLNVENRGLGPCGFNSYCTFHQKPSCHCPEGFSFIDPNDWSRGCQQNFVAQSCNQPASPETEPFYFYDMPTADWNLNDYERINEVTENFCRQNCLADCFCAAATYYNRNCYKKKSPLSSGRMDSSLLSKTMVKTRKGGNSTFQPRGGYSKPENKNHSTLIIIGSVLLSSSAFLNIFSLLVMVVGFVKRKRRNSQPLNLMTLPGMDLQCFTYEDIKIVTNEFKEEIGSGSFGRVFKGFLASASNIVNHVAVKRFNSMVAEREQEFKAEVSAIARTNHRNLVKLLGFCNEEQHRLLVYEFMSNGSLASFLFGDSRINWYTRIQVALEIARGLLYLHEGCSTQIIHCDIKPQNILLDDSFTAKISDFGLAKLLKTEQSRTMTGIRGTKGYVAPEWFRSLPITVKVDVYSYGILLLELICSRKCFDAEAEDEHQMVLADWAYDCYVERNLDQLMKDDKEAMEDLESVEKYVKIAIWCIQENPAKRPPMDRVIQMIEGSVQVPIPPDPSSS